ncbi:MAG: hypothetical protein LUH36_05745 [Oscillospiraceae bacterium]|nr:hypothetical protein [Oscillospiraceae bacterium]
MMVLIGICSFIAGAIFGVLLMGLLQIGSSREEIAHKVEAAPADTRETVMKPKLLIEEQEEEKEKEEV